MSKERRGGGLALGWPCLDRSHLFLEKLTVIIEVDHQGARTRRWSCLPVTPPHPYPPPIQTCFSLSPSLCWLSLHLLTHSAPFPHSLQSLFFLSFFFFFCKKGKQSEKYDYKMPVGFQGGGKKEIVSIPWRQPSLGPKRWCVGWGRGRGKPRACLKSLDPPELTLWSQEIARSCRETLAGGSRRGLGGRMEMGGGGRSSSFAPSRAAAAG